MASCISASVSSSIFHFDSRFFGMTLSVSASDLRRLLPVCCEHSKAVPCETIPEMDGNQNQAPPLGERRLNRFLLTTTSLRDRPF